MKTYIIINKEDGKFFEQDFAGWSFQQDKKHAYKFKTKADADSAAEWLTNSGYNVITEGA